MSLPTHDENERKEIQFQCHKEQLIKELYV